MIRREDVNKRTQASLKHIPSENTSDVGRETFRETRSRPGLLEKAADILEHAGGGTTVPQVTYQMNQQKGNTTLRKIPQLAFKAKKNVVKANIIAEGVIDPCTSHNAKHSAMSSKVPVLTSRLRNHAKRVSTPVMNKNPASKGNQKSIVNFHINPKGTVEGKVAKPGFTENKCGSKKKSSQPQSTMVGKFHSFSNMLHKNTKIDKSRLLEEVAQPNRSALKRDSQSGTRRNSVKISGRDNDIHVHQAMALSSGKKVKFADLSADDLNENSRQDVVDAQAKKLSAINDEFDRAKCSTEEEKGDIKQEMALKINEICNEISKESKTYFPIQKRSLPSSLIEDIKCTSENENDIDQFELVDKKCLETSQSVDAIPKNIFADTTQSVPTELLKEHKKYSIYTTMYENTPTPPKEVSSFPGLNLNFSSADNFENSETSPVKCISKQTTELFQEKNEFSRKTGNFAHSSINHWKNLKTSPRKCIRKETADMFRAKNEMSNGSSSIVHTPINKWKIPIKKSVGGINKNTADISDEKCPSIKSTTSNASRTVPEVSMVNYSEYGRISEHAPKPSKTVSTIPKSNITSPVKIQYGSFSCSNKEVPEVFQKSNVTLEEKSHSNFICKLSDTRGKTQCSGVTQILETTPNKPRKISSSPKLNGSISPVNQEGEVTESNSLEYENNRTLDTSQTANTTSKIVVSNIVTHTLPKVTVDEHRCVSGYSRMVERTSKKGFSFLEPTFTSNAIDKKEDISAYGRMIEHTPKTLSSIPEVNTTLSPAEKEALSENMTILKCTPNTSKKLSSVPTLSQISMTAEKKGEFSEYARRLDHSYHTLKKITPVSTLITNSKSDERNGEFTEISRVLEHAPKTSIKDSLGDYKRLFEIKDSFRDSSALKVHTISLPAEKKGQFSEFGRMVEHTTLKEFRSDPQLSNIFSAAENKELLQPASILEHATNTPKRISPVPKLNITPSPAKNEEFLEHAILMPHTHDTPKTITSIPVLNRNISHVENNYEISENKSVKSIGGGISEELQADKSVFKNTNDLNNIVSASQVSMQSEIAPKALMQNNEACATDTESCSMAESPQLQAQRQIPPKVESIAPEINEKVNLLKNEFLKEINENKRSRSHKTGKKKGILSKYYDEQMSKAFSRDRINTSQNMSPPVNRNLDDPKKVLEDDMEQLREIFEPRVIEETEEHDSPLISNDIRTPVSMTNYLNTTPTLSRIPRYINTSMSPQEEPASSRKSSRCRAGGDRCSQNRISKQDQGAGKNLLNYETPEILRWIEASRRNDTADNVRVAGEELTDNVRCCEQSDENYKEPLESDYFDLSFCASEVHKSTAHSEKLKSSEYLENVDNTAICSNHGGRDFVQFENSSIESVNIVTVEERGRGKCSCFNVACMCSTAEDARQSSRDERKKLYQQRKANCKAAVRRGVNDISIYRKLAISIFLFLMFSGLFIKFAIA